MKKRKFSPIIGKENKTVAGSSRYEFDDDSRVKISDDVTVEVPIDDIFKIDNGALAYAEETKLDWTIPKGVYDDAWYGWVEGYEVPIRQPDEIADDALDVLVNHMPYKSGKYHVTCTVHLEYSVSDVSVWDYADGPVHYNERYDEYEGDFESGMDTESMYVQLIFGKCYVSNLEIESIK